MTRNARHLAACAALLAAAACSTDETYQTGLVVRPSGLAYVEWENDPAAPVNARADLFIADPEAGGVSVAQFARYLTAGKDPVILARHVYLRAPNLFFPLVLPAPTYPAHVTTASTAATRMYVLSGVDGRLHVYAIGRSEYDVSTTASNPYALLGEVDLGGGLTDPQGLAGGAFDLGIAVDVKLLRDGGGATPDLLVMAVDDLGGGPSRLIELAVRAQVGTAATAEIVASATVAAGPRRIAVRSAAPRGVWVSSAATSSVTFVPLVGADRMLGTPRGVGVGGPTSAVVDAAESGAVALRIDRRRVVVLDVVGEDFARVARPSFTPYSTGTEGPGEVSVREIPVAGALGRVPVLPAPSGDIISADLLVSGDRGADGLAPVVMVAYADGGAAFLVGKPLRWPTQKIQAIAYTRDGVGGIQLPTCSTVIVPQCEAVTDVADVSTFACVGAEVIDRTAGIDVTYRGAFARASAMLASVTSTSVEAALDATATGFEAAQLDDRAFIVVLPQVGCSTTATISGEGSVRGIAADRVQLELDPGPLADLVAACTAPPTARIELFGAGPEFVFDRGDVVQRATATSTAGRYAARSDEGIVVDFAVADTASCAVVLDTVGACTTDADCPGATCVASDSNTCGGRCSPCAAGPGCWSTLPIRQCPSVSLASAARASGGNEIVAGFGTTNQALRFSVPEDVVFSPLRSGWIVSFPGGRAIGSAQVLPDGTMLISELR